MNINTHPATASTRWGMLVAGAAVLGLLLTGCGSSGPSAACVSAGTAPARIEAGLTVSTGVHLTGRSAAVKSKDFKNVYMVAAEFTGPGVTKAVGVWMTSNLNGGTVYRVDGFAHQFSDSGPGPSPADITTDGASEAKDCIG